MHILHKEGIKFMEEEYKMLREEIMFNLNKLNWYVSVLYTVSIALLAYVIENPENPILFSLIFVVLLCISSRIRSITTSNVRISSYMEVMLESQIPDRNWETFCHYKLQNKDSHSLIPINKKISRFIDIISRTSSVCLLLGIVTFVFNCFVLIENLNPIYVISTSFNLIILFVLCYMTYVNGNYIYRDKFVAHWKEIKKEMNNENHTQTK